MAEFKIKHELIILKEDFNSVLPKRHELPKIHKSGEKIRLLLTYYLLAKWLTKNPKYYKATQFTKFKPYQFNKFKREIEKCSQIIWEEINFVWCVIYLFWKKFLLSPIRKKRWLKSIKC